MALADPLAPEGVVLALRQYRTGVQAVQREHAGVPTAGDHSHMAAFLGAGIHSGKMLGNLCVGIKTINDIKHFCIFRCLFGKIGSTSAA